MKTITVQVTHKLTIECEEDDADLESIMGELNCDFHVCKEIDQAEVIDSEMEEWQILNEEEGD